MTAILWVLLPIVIAIGSALIAVFIMQQRMEVQLARERQSLAEARAALEAQKETLQEVDKLRRENAAKRSLDGFLQDIRSEQRVLVRNQKMMFSDRKCVVLQERLFFRNIPLCNWVEHEAPLEEGADEQALARTLAVFDPETLPGRQPVEAPKPAQQTKAARLTA